MAATSVLKLVVDDKEYSASLKNAKQGMQDLQQSLEKAGKSFADVDKSIIDYAKGLGQMETVSKTAKGQINEMSSAFVELSKVYNQMTEQEQQSPVGKALSESLGQLRQRTIDAKDEMANLNRQLEPVNSTSRETGGIIGALKDKLTLNVDALKLFNAGLQAAKAALDVAKDAFLSNEQSLDEWGRLVESSESLYKGFLDALNTGDIGGYLQNIDNIVQAARDAYNALDELNTFNAFNQRNVQKARTSMTESIADYRGGTGSKDAVKAAGEAYKKELEERKRLEKEAYIEAVGKAAAERGVSKEDLLTALSGTYGSYKALKEMPMSGTQTVFYGGGMFGGGGSYEKEVPNSIQEKLGAALRRLNDTELNYLQSLGAQADRTGEEIANVDKQVNRVVNGRGGSGNGGGGSSKTTTDTFAEGSIAEQENLVADLTKKWKNAGEAVRDDYKKELESAKAVLDNMMGNGFDASRVAPIIDKAGSTPMADMAKIDGPTIPVKIDIDTSPLTQLQNQLKQLTEQQLEFGKLAPEVWQSYQQSIDAVTAKIDEFKGKNTLGKQADSSKKSFQDAANAIGQVGNALNNIEDPAAKIVSTIAQAIASVAMAYAQALSQDSTTKSNIWAFLAAATASTVSMVATISTIKSATKFASGGVVPGNKFSNDQVPTMLNSGELVLNRFQQNVLAGTLENVGMQNMQLSCEVESEKLRFVLNNGSRRRGRGEYVTSTMR